ncbi:hypothetical protein LCGC14_1944960 [marine sediment metagenome]|uniref:Uncharacterized protein n=1 Tax=marine sediment metagenome TaxID=412755 RepID=A0A0F9FJ59_9ZZZZ
MKQVFFSDDEIMLIRDFQEAVKELVELSPERTVEDVHKSKIHKILYKITGYDPWEDGES